jgi:hypothetical protein
MVPPHSVSHKCSFPAILATDDLDLTLVVHHLSRVLEEQATLAYVWRSTAIFGKRYSTCSLQCLLLHIVLTLL